MMRSNSAVGEVLRFMKENKLDESDLVNYGGEDFNSPDQRRRRKAHRVEKCWELMARLGVKAANLSSGSPKS
jgi:hypothetical protein